LATRLRRFSRSKVTKCIVFTLTVLLITTVMVLLNYIYNSNIDPEPIFVKDYTKSDTFIYEKLSRGILDVQNHIINDTNRISPEPDYLYYITDGENTKQNADLNDILNQKDYLYKYTNGVWEYGENTYKNLPNYTMDKYTLYLVFPKEFLEQQQLSWNLERERLIPIVSTIIQSIIAGIICVIYLIAVTGRRHEDNEVHLTSYMDKIFSDIQLVIMLFVLYFWLNGTVNLLGYPREYVGGGALVMDQYYTMILTGIIALLASIICGVILLSLVRKIKAGRLIKHSLIFAIFAGISRFIRSFFDDSRFEHFPLTKSLNRRQVIFTVASGGMVFLSFIFLVSTRKIIMGLLPVLFEALIIFWYFYENSKTFDEINQGFQESLQERMKSERMKVDLITNVSHDLKTPLTSIISYVDLLSKEDLPDSARDYVKILADKSGRLKNIVSDLFDLAKSTSGNLPLDMENLDLRKLIEQTLGDMEDDIEKSGIRIKTSLTEDPVYIYSDGKKLYRVFQNIIGNALKYSLSGTRVFIDMVSQNNIVSVSVKNTASYDMDFTAEEILQRFSRGDKSRTTEGSGLGLSIAESFTWACGGRFKVEIDGDQFKVRLEFPIIG
jgi:signal transduction histidine kinase